MNITFSRLSCFDQENISLGFNAEDMVNEHGISLGVKFIERVISQMQSDVVGRRRGTSPGVELLVVENNGSSKTGSENSLKVKRSAAVFSSFPGPRNSVARQSLHSPTPRHPHTLLQLRPEIPLHNRIHKLLGRHNFLPIPIPIKLQNPHILVHVLARRRVPTRTQPHDDFPRRDVLNDVVDLEVEVAEHGRQGTERFLVGGVVLGRHVHGFREQVARAGGAAEGHYGRDVHVVEGGDELVSCLAL
jgi:hypothetical protein